MYYTNIIKFIKGIIRKCYPLCVLKIKDNTISMYISDVFLYDITISERVSYFTDVGLVVGINMKDIMGHTETLEYIESAQAEITSEMEKWIIKKVSTNVYFQNILKYKEKYDDLLNRVMKLKNVIPEILHDEDPTKLLDLVYNHFESENEYETAKERFYKNASS